MVNILELPIFANAVVQFDVHNVEIRWQKRLRVGCKFSNIAMVRRTDGIDP